jgi:hypothetical protein
MTVGPNLPNPAGLSCDPRIGHRVLVRGARRVRTADS